MDFSTVNHISFSNSGIDTDTLVQKLMQAEQVPLNQLKQKQQKDLWLSDAYRQWNSDLLSFRNDDFSMELSNNYDTFQTSSSLTNAVTATGTSNAVEGTYNLTVKQIAQSATLTGNTGNLDSSQPLGITTSFTLSVGDPNNPSTLKSATINVGPNDKISDVVTHINNATFNGQSLGIKAVFDPNLKQFIVKTNSTGAAARISLSPTDASGNTDPNAVNFLNNTLGFGQSTVIGSQTLSGPVQITTGTNDTFNINLGNNSSANITLAGGTYNSVQDYVNEINKELAGSSLNGQVSALLDSANHLVFSSKVAGDYTLNVTSPVFGSPAGATQPPGFSSSINGTMSAVGSNADIIFNNQEMTTFATNNITLLGTNYTLKSPTVDLNGNPTTPGAQTFSTITVNRDIDTEMKNIEGFVSKYNDMLTKLNSAISEPVYRDYQPLTDDQKSQMSDTQIQQWETKAKSGLMNNDSILSPLVNKMRNAMTTPVTNGSAYNSLASIGITSHSYSDKGKLYVDESKLREALQNDPDGVKKLFSQTGNGVGNQGVTRSLYNSLNDAYNQLVKKAGLPGMSQYDTSFVGKDLSSLQTQISDMTTKLQQKETSYYNMYDAMQQAVAQFQSQGSMLSQALGLGTTSTSG